MSVDLPGDIFPIAGDDAGAIPSTQNDTKMKHWREETFNQALEQFDWGLPESDLSLIVVIRSFQDSTRCGCYLGHVDLVCIMTVFEQTAAFFDYIAKSGFDGTVKVGIGYYCMSLTDDASLKRILVLELVKQANELLDSVSTLAQNMCVPQNEPGVKTMGRSPACLNQLNLNYVREAIASFKKLFRLITDFFDENKRREA